MKPMTPAVPDPRVVPRTVERDVLRASLSARLFAEDNPVKVGRFVIIERAGSGGMGVVYRAYDPELEREVALKLLLRKPDCEQQRLMREARAVAKVVHPNVVSIFEVGTSNGDLFVAMEYIAGSTLREWGELERDPQRIVAMHIEAGRGLAAAHAAGVIHRDYKPDNVLIGSDGRPRVVDFGLARSAPLGPQPIPRPAADIVSTLGGLDIEATPGSPTATGDVIGTPAYMAPEQFVSAAIDERADQYSFCVTLFEALTGSRPFGGQPGFARAGQPELLDGVRVHRRVRLALQRGLALEPDDRFESMQALLDALEGASNKGRRLLLIGAAAVVGALAAAAAMRDPGAGDSSATTTCGAMDDAFDRLVSPSEVQRVLERVEGWDIEPHSLVADRVESRRATWIDVAQTACTEFHLEGATTRASFDAKMECLRDSAANLDLTLGIAADSSQPTRVLPVLGSSARTIDCGVESVALGRANARVEEDPQSVAVLRERLERAEAEAFVYGRAKLIPELESVQAEAATLSSASLQADTAYELASAYAAASRRDDAELLLKKTYRLARVVGDVDLAVDTARFLSNFCAAYSDDRQAEASVWADIALAEVDDPRVSTNTAIGTLLAASHTRDSTGDPEGALEARLGAARLLHEREVPETDQLTFKVYSELAATYDEMGRYVLAEQLYRKVMEGRLRAYPHDRSGNAGVVLNLGRMLHALGRQEEGLLYLERGHASVDKDERPRRWVRATSDLVGPLVENGQLERAESLLREADEILETVEGPGRDLSHILDGWAALHESRGELESALEASERATEIATAAAPTDPSTAAMHLRHARLLVRLRRPEQAREALDRARSLYPSQHPAWPRVEATAVALSELHEL